MHRIQLAILTARTSSTFTRHTMQTFCKGLSANKQDRRHLLELLENETKEKSLSPACDRSVIKPPTKSENKHRVNFSQLSPIYRNVEEWNYSPVDLRRLYLHSNGFRNYCLLLFSKWIHQLRIFYIHFTCIQCFQLELLFMFSMYIKLYLWNVSGKHFLFDDPCMLMLIIFLKFIIFFIWRLTNVLVTGLMKKNKSEFGCWFAYLTTVISRNPADSHL